MRIFLSLAAACLALAATAAESEVWQLGHETELGGRAIEKLGAPRIMTDPVGTAMRFNGASDGVFVPVNPLAGSTSFTIEILFNPDANGPGEQRFLHLQDESGNRALIELRLANGTWALDTFLLSTETRGRRVLFDANKRHPAGQWTWAALVYDGRTMTHYINGGKELEGPVVFPATRAGRVSLGVRQNKVHWFKGGIREIRWHRTALPEQQLQRP